MITAGEKLRQTRTGLGVTLEQAERATKIKKSFLNAIERDDYKSLPSPTYAQGFVRNYALFLGIPRSEIMPLFKRQYDEKKAYDVLPKGFTRTSEISTHHIRIRRTVLALGLFFLVFICYLLFQFRSLFLAPSLHITSPTDGATVSQDVTVSGRTDTEATVYINGVLVGIDQDGVFTKTLTIFPGKGTLTIISRNRFGKETAVERTILAKPRY